ncbi:MAG TPA: hypothetical protein PK955_00200, partial [Methanoregulaceae archaeon]|nr:hypothetical protein [Methanoregulaceae archaeon]
MNHQRAYRRKTGGVVRIPDLFPEVEPGCYFETSNSLLGLAHFEQGLPLVIPGISIFRIDGKGMVIRSDSFLKKALTVPEIAMLDAVAYPLEIGQIHCLRDTSLLVVIMIIFTEL